MNEKFIGNILTVIVIDASRKIEEKLQQQII